MFFNSWDEPHPSSGASLDADARRREIRIALAFVCAIGLLYLPLSFVRFAYHDDYAYLVIHGYRAQNPLFMADGRPLGGMLAVALFSTFDQVSTAGWLRFIGLLQLLLSAYFMQRAAVSVGLQPLWAGAFVALFAATPPVQNWVIWGVSAWQLPALVLSSASFFFWRGLSGENGRWPLAHGVLFFVFNLAALLIYQPFATAVWPLILLDVIHRQGRRSTYRQLALALAIYAAAILVFFILFKAMVAQFVPPALHGRTSTLPFSDIPNRLLWFLKYPVAAALTPVRAHPAAALTAATSAVILFGLFSVSASRRLFLWHTAAAVATAFLVHSPSLLSHDVTGVRTNVVIAALGLSLLCLGMQTLTALLRVPPAWLRAGLVAGSFAVAARATYVMMTFGALPQAFEIALVERRLDQTVLPPGGTILLIGVRDGLSLGNGGCDDFAPIGCASSAKQFGPPNMVRLWMRRRGIDEKRYRLLFVPTADAPVAVSFEPDWTTYGPRPADAFVIDLGRDLIEAAETRRKG